MFDYAKSPDRIQEAATRNFHQQMDERVAASGEPFRCYLDTGALHERVRALGFTEIEDLDRAALVGRYLPDAAVAPRPGPGGHVVRLATSAESIGGACNFDRELSLFNSLSVNFRQFAPVSRPHPQCGCGGTLKEKSLVHPKRP